jgi:perosamine synthetase
MSGATTASSFRLAVHGGPRVRPVRMPPRRAFGDDELRAVQEVFAHYQERGVDFGYQGVFEQRYTDAFVRYLGVEGYADAVCTGTAALFVSLAALDLPPGSHVLVSPVTDPGTISAILVNRLVPVLMDSAPASYNVGLEQFLERLTPETRAVVVVHAAGQPAPIDAICEAARERGIPVIEDCSQAHGARLADGRQVGTIGDIGAFSTMYRKAHASGGCGGLVFTRDRDLYRRCRAHADRGKPFWIDNFDDKDPSTFLFAALNLHTDELSCAIGLKSLNRLDDTIRRRHAFIVQLANALRERSEVCRPYAITEGDSPFYYPIFVDAEKLGCPKLEFARAVQAEGIDLNPQYQYVVGDWPWVQPHLAGPWHCPNAIECRDRSFNILLNENYGEREVNDVVSAIVKVERALSL